VNLIPKITQETLAEMIGTTRSRVSFFMNRFTELGFVEYEGRNSRAHDQIITGIAVIYRPDRIAACCDSGRGSL
jgi:CRP/FNR family cyclic AMP-dependent transcriptional regulator